jgi:medium-chain acyl-[acyl-carrier-protein] hydrolase
MIKIDRPKAAAADIHEAEPELMGTSIIGRSALDLVGHVHNIKYIEMAEDMMPADIWAQAPFDNFRIHYRKEITEGEKISFKYSFIDNLKHEIRMENEAGELNAAVRMWNTPLT